MAGELGLEPRITGSKPGALPAWLHPIMVELFYLSTHHWITNIHLWADTAYINHNYSIFRFARIS